MLRKASDSTIDNVIRPHSRSPKVQIFYLKYGIVLNVIIKSDICKIMIFSAAKKFDKRKFQ